MKHYRRPHASLLAAPGSALAIIAFLTFALFTFGASASASASASSAATSSSSSLSPGISNTLSQSNKSDWICHTDNPKDCYPRVFQATDEFQVVHEDQELPQGLHVKLNIWTGQKEAKINVPDEQNPALQGLPVDSAVVIVDQEQPESATPSPPDGPQIPKGAPAYEPAGQIKTPTDESQTFYDSVAVLKTLGLHDRPMDEALEVLREISHDIYYGLKIAEDANAVETLLCMMSTQDVFDDQGANSAAANQAAQAASIIGAALQNNPKALQEVEKSWGAMRKSVCGAESRDLGHALARMLMPDDRDREGKGPAGNAAHSDGLTKAKTGALKGLIRSPAIRDDFLANGGMEQILEVLLLARPDMESARRKLANLVLDTFLDEGMGATLGVWPRQGDIDYDWDFKLKTLAKQHKWDRDHWSAELWKKLQEHRRATRNAPEGRHKASPPHNEL